MSRLGFDFWIIQVVGWLLVVWYTVTQCFAALFWDQAVAWELQDGPERVTEVGVAFWYGFAFGDLVFYTPLLAAGLVGTWIGAGWGRILLAAALGITAYWPIVALAAVIVARDAPGWHLDEIGIYWVILIPIIVWSLWGIWRLARTV